MLDPIEELLEGRKKPLCLQQDETVRDALVKMVEHDYSQLPVINKEGKLTGIVSEQTIARQYYHLDEKVSLLDLTVDHCQETAVILSREDSGLFEILERLENSYAVVILSQLEPVGIVTDYDTTHFFRDWSEGLIRIQNIELTLRQYIEDIYPTEIKRTAILHQALGSDKQDPSKLRKTYEDLTFHDHLQLITHEKAWPKFEKYLKPKQIFSQQMMAVNQARNQLAHFRGSLDAIQADALIRAQQWLARRPKVEQETKIVAVSDVEIKMSDSKGKYAPLQDWLTAQAQRISPGYDIQRTFADIEVLIGDPLPPTAREHRAWWANDSTSPQRQSMAWMRAGWKVESVDFTQETVNFRRTDTVLYQLFFADMLKQLKETRPGITRANKTSAQNWFNFSGGRTGFAFAWVFTQDHRFRVELYIDSGNKVLNKNAYDLLLTKKEYIEQEIGINLNWDRLDDKQASRISVSRPTRITDTPNRLEETRAWGLDMTLKFSDTFTPLIKELDLE